MATKEAVALANAVELLIEIKRHAQRTRLAPSLRLSYQRQSSFRLAGAGAGSAAALRFSSSVSLTCAAVGKDDRWYSRPPPCSSRGRDSHPSLFALKMTPALLAGIAGNFMSAHSAADRHSFMAQTPSPLVTLQELNSGEIE